MSKNKWKKISSEPDYERPYIKMMKEKFILPNGEEDVFYKLKKDDFIVIIPMDKDFVYLIDSYRWAVGKNSLELAAGFIEKRETSLEAAKRELKEETGIAAKKFTRLGWFYVWIGMSDIKGYVFLAENLAFGKQNLERNEFGTVLKKVKLADMENLIRNGKIINGTTLNAFYLYTLFIKNKKKL